VATTDLRQTAADHLWLHFTRMGGQAPPIIVRGDGCYLEDVDGKRYLDALAGLFSVNLGYGYGEEIGQAALEQQRMIEELGRRWQAEGKKPFSVGMGINTGSVVMGNLGSSARMNYTVIGEDVNVAARLYNVAAGGQIIVSESTYDEVKDAFELRELAAVTVKGKSAPLRWFEVLGQHDGYKVDSREF